MIKLTEEINLSDYKLIIPAVAVGNVGQLALDLLITSMSMRKIGHVINSCFIPILGADPYVKNSSSLCTSCDIYCQQTKKIVAIQIRSPVVKNLQSFFDELKKFIEEKKISQVAILTSGWSHTRSDIQIRTEPMRYLASPSIQMTSGKLFESLDWLELESTTNAEGTECVSIAGGGFALKLHEFLVQNKIPSVVILRFCSEGDNVPDAVAFVDYLNKWLSFGFDSSKVKFPDSWEFLFGNPAPLDIY
ncbi:proteasome assembly chaperone 2 [Microplitis mediator]|uniref:proteasome assembly chaperone 2 n=1 Tax=Microplitis mediator TaxID=375433 RepID=UPI00255514C1|nr:proteasome assembly chaperone 2 [Microplitis mediator]